MISGRDVREPPAGLCWFMLQRLPPLLEAFSREIGGVRTAEDIEYIHRMRVASRRLRAALPVFRPCFPEKQYARWMTGLTRITRALGAARDTDVQIAYLRKYLKKHERKATGTEPDLQITGVPAARFLLADLEKHRAELQGPVNKALDALEKSGLVSGMQAAFSERYTLARSRRRTPPLHAIPMVGARKIASRIRVLHSYEPWISHPEAVAEHHATRIAAKKLRYTLEIYGPAYRNGLLKYHARVKRIQEILGDLHDCDVWIDRIISLRLRERSLLRTESRRKRPSPEILASLAVFLMEKEKERRGIYRQFTRYWAMLERTGTWDDLMLDLDGKRKVRFRPPARFDEEKERVAVSLLASTSPETVPHSITVTRLSLMLFDSLAPLHHLSGRDRFLLESAGMLHDIGWTGGAQDHHRRGATRILSEERLAFDLPERGIIALAVSSHRGGRTPAEDPLYRALPDESREKSMKIAALLRIADGLDVLHSGTVTEAHCITGPDAILCDVRADGDCTAEKARAQAKADLFGQVFSKPLVIR